MREQYSDIPQPRLRQAPGGKADRVGGRLNVNVGLEHDAAECSRSIRGDETASLIHRAIGWTRVSN